MSHFPTMFPNHQRQKSSSELKLWSADDLNVFHLLKTGIIILTLSLTRSLENTVGKGEIARNKQFLLFPQCFLLVWRTICHFHQI